MYHTPLQPPAELTLLAASSALTGEELTLFRRDDMWVTGGEVSAHKDNTSPGFLSFVWVICNDSGLSLFEGCENARIWTYLPVGSMFTLDARNVTHGVSRSQRKGRFGFLAWDMPVDDFSLERFHRELVSEFFLI